MSTVLTELRVRLYCEACTGVAEYATEPKDGGTVICKNCGKPTPRKKESYIPMSESEKRRLKALAEEPKKK